MQAGPDEVAHSAHPTYLAERLLGATGGVVEAPGSGILVRGMSNSSYHVDAVG